MRKVFNVECSFTNCRIGAHEGRIDSPLLSVAQWGSALKNAGFGEVELATDVLDYQASTIVASALPVEEIANGKIARPLQIITSSSVRSKSQYNSFADKLLESFEGAGYAPSFGEFPLITDKLVKYVVLEDGAQPFVQQLIPSSTSH
jgi:hypothetical protein